MGKSISDQSIFNKSIENLFTKWVQKHESDKKDTNSPIHYTD